MVMANATSLMPPSWAELYFQSQYKDTIHDPRKPENTQLVNVRIHRWSDDALVDAAQEEHDEDEAGESEKRVVHQRLCERHLQTGGYNMVI